MATSPPAASPPPDPTPIADPSAAQTLFSGLGAIWRNLSALNPGELALNLGLSVLVVTVVALATWAIRCGLRSGVDRLIGPAASSEDRPKRGAPVARISWLLIRVCLVAAAAIALLSIWGVNLFGWLTTTGAGAILTRVVGVLLIAVAMVEVAGHLVDRLLRSLSRRLNQTRRSAQMKTLGPLVRGVAQGFIIVVASLMIMSDLGVQIGPLLASAGVVGIAVGFGAQTLVKDFLTGLFLVVEDIVAVGDVIAVGDKSGTVEAMTLRTIRLRDLDATLHVLPYSEAKVISNRTKTFSAYVFDLGVAYDTDFDHAFAVMRRVGDALQADPEFGPKILLPLEIMGVQQFGDSSIVLRARFRTHPGEQWVVGRAYNKRIKEAFDAEGIEIPFPIRRLLVAREAASDQPLTDEQIAVSSDD
jgi:small-conductance mechanosensitive channel